MLLNEWTPYLQQWREVLANRMNFFLFVGTRRGEHCSVWCSLLVRYDQPVAPAGAIYAVPQQCHQQRRRQKAAGGSGSRGELTYIRTHVSCVTHIRAILSGELLSLFLVPETRPQAENNLSSPTLLPFTSLRCPSTGNHLIALCPVNSCLLFLDVYSAEIFQFRCPFYRVMKFEAICFPKFYLISWPIVSFWKPADETSLAGEPVCLLIFVSCQPNAAHVSSRSLQSIGSNTVR